MSATYKTIRKLWSAEEDRLLLQLTEKHGTNGCWPLIAVRERYINHLDPDMKRSPWTTKEDRYLKDLYPELGTKWSQYMTALPGRSDNAIKNRYHVVSRMNSDSQSVSDKSTVITTGKKRCFDCVSSDEESILGEDGETRLKRLKVQRQLLDAQIREMEEADSLLSDISSESLLSELSVSTDFSDLEGGIEFDFDFDDELW